MPDLIYNVKFEIDQASAQKVGNIVDTSNSEDIKVLQKEVERLNNVLKESRVENGKVNKSVKEKILAYKEEVASLKLLDSKINKSIQVYGEFSDETMSLVSDLRMQSQAVDNTGQELLGLANASDRTTGEVIALTNAVSTGNRAMVTSAKRAREFTSAQSIMEGQMGEGIKTFSAGNQAIFSFSDLIQDSTQFSYGFATGMRAIGNNISFTAELLAYLSKEAKASGQTLRQSLLASLKGVNGVVLALNFAVTVGTILLEKFGKKSKETADDLDEANEAGDRFLQTTDALIEALEKVNILTSPEAAKKRRLAELDIEITRLQTIEHQNVQQERALRIALDTLKNSRIAERIRFQEGVSLEQRNAFALAQFSIQQEIDKLDIGKKERAEEISALQKEQMELGTQIRIDAEAAAKAQAEALDVFGDESPAESIASLQQALKELTSKYESEIDASERAILESRIQGVQTRLEFMKNGLAEVLSLEDLGVDDFQVKIIGESDVLKIQDEERKRELDEIKAQDERKIADMIRFQERATDVFKSGEEARLNIKKNMNNALLSLAQVLADKNKNIAIALLAIEKGLAIAEFIISGKKEASKASALGAFYSANPLTAPLGASYFAAAGAITANTIATVAAITAQGIGQASSISRAGGGGGASGGTRSIGVGANTRFLPTAQQSEEESFRAFGESVNFTPNSPSFKLSENIIVEQNVKGKDLALVVRAGNKELKSSQVIG